MSWQSDMDTKDSRHPEKDGLLVGSGAASADVKLCDLSTVLGFQECRLSL